MESQVTGDANEESGRKTDINQRAGWWQRYQQASRGAQVGLAAAAVIGLCVVCSCFSTGGLVALGSVLPPVPTATNQTVRLATTTPISSDTVTAALTTTPSDTATTSPVMPATPTRGVPTATPKPTIPQRSVKLGGSVFAFDDKFGSNNCCYLNGWNYNGQYGPMWTGVATGDPEFDEHSTERVVGIDSDSTQSTPASWTMNQAKTICGGFMPTDAKYKSTSTVYLANLVVGVEYHYSSASLANTLPASDFKDLHGKSTTPGTFYIFYETDGGNSVSQCSLSTDENFAQNPF